MKSIRVHSFGDPSVLRYETVPDPVPAAGQVLIRVRAIGVNPVDTYIRAGIYGPQQFPFVPGYDACGQIEQVGAGVSNFKVGDRVVLYRPPSGAYAELIACEPAHLFTLPSALSFEEGAGLGVPYFTAQVALFDRGRAAKGEAVLIHGATGGVGTAAIQLAHAAGLKVLGTGSTDKGKSLATKLGASRVFDHSKPGYLEEIRNATDGRGPDLIIEMLANVNLENDMTIAAPKGRIVIVGNRGKIEITPRLMMKGNLDVLGMSLHNTSDAELHRAWSQIAQGVESGKLKPIIGETMPLAQAAKAHEKILEPGAAGKIILVP
ncbi:MAG: NADPH:quinone reductase [Phycisphaeraceae bacterium]|nr:NADPH:quinone reductase [Phycisphaeraceae bacterium]